MTITREYVLQRGGNMQRRVRAVLRERPDGLTVRELCELVDAERWSVNASLKTMPDAYIDRWVPNTNNRHMVAVWCVVVPPEHCPRPG